MRKANVAYSSCTFESFVVDAKCIPRRMHKQRPNPRLGKPTIRTNSHSYQDMASQMRFNKLGFSRRSSVLAYSPRVFIKG
jgi:hypothetical protein